MRSSDSLANIAPALVKAVNAIEGAKKGSTNPHFKSSYANLESVIQAAHEALSENNLAVMQGPGPLDPADARALTLTTRIIHESGEWIETDFSLPMAKPDPQAAGSAVTYARRYSLMAMLNMAALDDDGESAMLRPKDDGPRVPKGLNVQPEGDDWYGAEGPGMTASQAKKDGWGETVDGWHGSLELIPTVEVWRQWARDNDEAIKALPKGWRIDIRTIFDRRGRELGAINQ